MRRSLTPTRPYFCLLPGLSSSRHVRILQCYVR